MSQFVFVLVPADNSQPVVTLSDSTAGGLENDAVIKTAKKHFQESQSHRVMANQDLLREGVRGNLAKTGMNAAEVSDELIDRMSRETSVEIFPVTVPSPRLEHIAVSMYCDDKGVAKGLPINARASYLSQACGHQNHTVRGDVFIARYFDNEDAWERRDFTETDMEATSAWVTHAREMNSSRGTSASQGLQQIMTNAAQVGSQDAGDTASHSETWGTWTQSAGEVELRIPLPENANKKAVKVVFKQDSLRVQCEDVSMEGTLFDTIDVDGCNWTFDREGPTPKLIVTLEKKLGAQWPQIMK